MERERDIEKWLRRQVEGMGRLALLPGGRVWFIELKTGRGRLAPVQSWQLARLRALGCRAAVLRGKAEAAEWLEERRKEADAYGVYTARLSEAGD